MASLPPRVGAGDRLTDVSDFINDWFTDQAEGGLTTEVNGDGASNSTDVSDYINLWFATDPSCPH